MGRKPTPTIPIPTSLPDCRYLYTIIQGQRQKPRRQLGCLEVIGYLGQRRESFTRTRRYQFRERPSILLEKGFLYYCFLAYAAAAVDFLAALIPRITMASIPSIIPIMTPAGGVVRKSLYVSQSA
ncbi:hypothetical protein V8E54_001882 [Elaphomyces granulatus]